MEFLKGQLDPEDISAIVGDHLEPPNRAALGPQGIDTVIEEIRRRTSIPHEQEVVLLTPTPNKINFFALLLDRNNTYIHTANWETYIHAEFDAPVAYILGRNILMRGMYDSAEEGLNNLHRTPRGCISDFCFEKHQIQLLMRTADACPDCMKTISNRIEGGYMKSAVARDCFNLLERTRTDLLYVKQFAWNEEPNRIRIEGLLQQIDLVGEGKRFKLSPIQRALYLTFLECPEGFPLTHLPDEKHISRLRDHYLPLAKTDDIEEQMSVVANLATDDDTRRQHLSKIRAAFRDILGKEKAPLYTIERDEEGTYKIALDRKYVIWLDRQDRPKGYMAE